MWTRQNLLNLLRNPAYAGLREINKLNKSKLQEDLKPWQQHQTVKAAWPAIISEEVFKRAKQTLDDAYMVQCQRLAKRVTRIFLGTGVLKCGECGAPYMGAASHGKNLVHRYYVHRKLTGVPLTCKNKRIPADNIENDIARHITEVLARDGYLDQIEGNIERNIKEAIADYVEQKNFLKGKLESLDKEIAEVFQLHRQMSGTPGVELVREKLAELSTQKTALAAQLGEIDDYIANVPTAKAARSVVEKGMGDFITAWKRATPSQQKKLVARLFMRSRVTARGLGVRYRWTSPDQSACMNPETKKAVDSSSTATNSNLTFLETHRGGNSVPLGGDFLVANASTAKNGRESEKPSESCQLIDYANINFLEIAKSSRKLQVLRVEKQLSMRELSKATGHSRGYLRSQLRKFGIASEKDSPRLAPFGWDWKGNELVPNAKEAPILCEILALNKSGKGCKSIASELNRRGIPSKTGGLWGHSSVQNILNRDAAYLRERAQ